MKHFLLLFARRQLSGQLIERVATEFNKLQFYVTKSKGLPLVEKIKPVSCFHFFKLPAQHSVTGVAHEALCEKIHRSCDVIFLIGVII